MGWIYIIINLVNFKVYIGKWSGKRIKTRLDHYRNAKSHNHHLNNAVKKYGVDNFLFGVLHEDIPKESLVALEIKEITRFDCNKCAGGWGYNQTDGGEGRLGYKHQEDTKRKISDQMIGEKNPMYGKIPHNYGKSPSEKTRRKQSEAKIGENNHNYGKPMPEDTKRKISEAQIGRIFSEKHRCNLSKALSGNPKISGENHPMYGKTHSEKALCKMRRPEYYEAQWYFTVFLSPDMTTNEKRKQLRIKYPEIDRSIIYRWTKQWQDEIE